MLFMIVERFRGGDAVPVYRRFRERGRQFTPGLTYRGSWVSADLTHCYQLMESPDRASLEGWMAAWSDLAEFEVVEVMTSEDAQRAIAPRP
jgi:hypothetical protein